VTWAGVRRTPGGLCMPEALARRVSGGLAIVALALAGYYSVFAGAYNLSEVRDIRAQERTQVARVDSLKGVLDSVTIWADSLETDPAVIERVARERHSFIRPGERLYLFVEEPESGSETRP